MDIENLINNVESIIEDAKKEKSKFDEPINWGDLSVVEIEKVERYYNKTTYYRVIIEEASRTCPKFHAFIYIKLKELGYDNIEISTEW
jgi:hypothetical protein